METSAWHEHGGVTASVDSVRKLRFSVKSNALRFRVPQRRRLLVVGGAGYIGSLLVERLLEDGYRVRVLDNLLYGDESLQMVRNHPNFELVVGDCRNVDDVITVARGMESIIHLAAIVGDRACDQNHELALATNYTATKILTDVAMAYGVHRFLFASSCSVYGISEFDVGEDAVVRPISFYAKTKVASERVLLKSKNNSFNPTILRFATAFGLGHRPRFDLLVNALTAKSHREGVITIHNGHQWRPFIHVRDLVEGIVRVLRAPVRLMSGQVFNMGDTRLNHTLTEVAGVIQQVFPEVRIEYIDNADHRNYRVKFDKLLTQTGLRARYSVYDGVEEIKRALEERKVADYTDVRYNNERWLKLVGSPAK